MSRSKVESLKQFGIKNTTTKREAQEILGDIVNWKKRTIPIFNSFRTMVQRIEDTAGVDAEKVKGVLTRPRAKAVTEMFKEEIQLKTAMRDMLDRLRLKGKKDRALIMRYGEGRMTLEELKKKKSWFFNRAPELRTKASKEKTKYTPELKGKKKFDSAKASKSLYAFSVPNGLLQDIPDEECYIRIQGGEAGLSLTHSPHIVLSSVWRSYTFYSDEDFVIPPSPQMGIAAAKEDADYLKALSIYLHSSLVSFYVFFHAEQWGIYRRARQVLKRPLEKLPVPEFTKEQIDVLVALHEKLVKDEKQAISNFISGLQQNLDPTRENQEPSLLTDFTKGERKLAKEFRSELRAKLQREIDDTIFSLFRIPRDIQMLVNEFIHIRLALDDRSTMAKATREPTQQELLDYARELQAELDGFLMGKAYHRVYINQSEHLIECVVEITKENETIQIDEHRIKKVNSTISATLANISDGLREQISQWVYVQRGLRLFDGPRIYIYKAPRLIDWTKTQAINDAGDIIGQAVSSGISIDDNNQAK
ncbi:hypothetical protein IH992_30235 [Candidatus Poribacteria bacterium]|nr:hypothetical protein [Candidatus Poribacteria bacterium]